MEYKIKLSTYQDSHKELLSPMLDKIKLPFPLTVQLGKASDDEYVINSRNGIIGASDKLAMKKLFLTYGVPTTDIYDYWSAWWLTLCGRKLVIKATERKNGEGYVEIFEGQNIKKSYIEDYFFTQREFRMHVSPIAGCFFAVEKLDRNKSSWKKHLTECRFVSDFFLPHNWEQMIGACAYAVDLLGLDIGACDVLWNRNEFIIAEINSAPGMGKNTVKAYADAIKLIAHAKYGDTL